MKEQLLAAAVKYRDKAAAAVEIERAKVKANIQESVATHGSVGESAWKARHAAELRLSAANVIVAALLEV